MAHGGVRSDLDDATRSKVKLVRSKLRWLRSLGFAGRKISAFAAASERFNSRQESRKVRLFQSFMKLHAE